MSVAHTEGDGHTSVGHVALVVGPGDRFLSGVSYYTSLLASALAEHGPVAMLLLRRLCPRVVYPGRARVGKTDGTLPLPAVPVFNGLDWFWGPSALGAWRFWRRVRPNVVILQWWTATVLHSYLALAWLAKRSRRACGGRASRGARRRRGQVAVGKPIHPSGDAPSLEPCGRRRRAVRVRSRRDAGQLSSAGYIAGRGHPARVPRDVRRLPGQTAYSPTAPAASEVNLFACLSSAWCARIRATLSWLQRSVCSRRAGLDVHVSVVGEVWQGYRQPLDELAAILPAGPTDHRGPLCRRRRGCRFLRRRSSGRAALLARSSASGPLSIAMNLGLPLVTTSVGGLVEATAGYTGAVLVPPGDPAALAEGIRTALPLIGTTHADPHSWPRTAERYAALLDRIDADWSQQRSDSGRAAQ